MGRQLRWLVAGLGIVVPLAAVLASLAYGDMVWLLFALAGGAMTSVLLIELSERGDRPHRRASAEGSEELFGLRVFELRPPGDK